MSKEKNQTEFEREVPIPADLSPDSMNLGLRNYRNGLTQPPQRGCQKAIGAEGGFPKPLDHLTSR